MSGSDHLIINTRERASSVDINNLESLKDRSVLDRISRQFSRRLWTPGLIPADLIQNVILEGLAVAPVGTDVSVSVGVLVQNSAVLLPAPGVFDSDYRIGFNRTVATLTPPAGLGFYVLEAQMIEVITVATFRDIFDTGTGLFVPTLVDKVAERQLAFRFIFGSASQAPAPTFGDWVPIAVVQQTGVPLTVTELTDVRPMWDRDLPKTRDQLFFPTMARGDRTVRTSEAPVADNNISLGAEVFSDPQRLIYQRSGAFDPTAAAVVEPGTVFALNTFYYLYLAPWQGLAPIRQNDPSANTRGILVLSATAPAAQGGSRNGAVITLPAPFGTGTVPIGSAVCVASLRRNAANTFWIPSASVHRDRFVIQQVLAALAVPIATPLTVALAAFIPVTAKAVHVLVNISDNGGAAVRAILAPSPVGAGLAASWSQYDYLASAPDSVDFWVPVQTSTSFDLNQSLGTAPDVNVFVIGWAE